MNCKEDTHDDDDDNDECIVYIIVTHCNCRERMYVIDHNEIETNICC